jgi:putative membrane protein PagO
MDSERVRIWIAFFVVCTVWGSTWLAIKIGLETVPPLLAAGIRFVIASSLLAVIVKVRGIPVPRDPDAIRVYLTLGILSFFLPFGLVYWGQQYIPSGLSSILFAAYPAWVALFSHFALSAERMDVFKASGVALGALGLAVIFSRDVHWFGTEGLLGMSAVMISTVLQAGSLVIIKKYGQPVSPFSMNLVGMSLGAALLLVSSLAFENPASAVFTLPAVASILYLAIIGSVLTFGSYFWLLKRTEAVYLSLTSFVNPIIAVVLGAIILGEKLAPPVLLGATLVLLGILAANGRYFLKRARHAP